MSNPVPIDIDAIIALHRDSILNWQENPVKLTQQNFLSLVEENHALNYALWHAEDKARREDRGYQFVYQAKRDIDQFNQQRNNKIEGMDDWLFKHLSPCDPSHCAVNSEPPGMMIDRLSILSLKVYFMGLQTTRLDVSLAHHQNCQQKLATLLIQQQQLYTCLHQLIKEVILKTRTFRIYRQFKMYNDTRLNPELYNA